MLPLAAASHRAWTWARSQAMSSETVGSRVERSPELCCLISSFKLQSSGPVCLFIRGLSTDTYCGVTYTPHSRSKGWVSFFGQGWCLRAQDNVEVEPAAGADDQRREAFALRCIPRHPAKQKGVDGRYTRGCSAEPVGKDSVARRGTWSCRADRAGSPAGKNFLHALHPYGTM